MALTTNGCTNPTSLRVITNKVILAPPRAFSNITSYNSGAASELSNVNPDGTHEFSGGASDGASDKLVNVASDDLHESRVRQVATTNGGANTTYVAVTVNGVANAD